MIHQILSYIAAADGVLSAILWWKASTVLVKRGDPRAVGSTFVGDVAIQATYAVQSRLNTWAALATGLAGAASGLAQLFSN